MPEWKLISKSGQQNYMGEVSQAPHCLTQTETNRNIFFLILFSSLIGIDAPYFLLIIILSFIIVCYMVTTVSCGHWGTHLDCHPFLHHSKQRGLVVPSHLVKTVSRFGRYIN